MIKSNQRLINAFNIISDGIIIVLAYFFSLYIKFNFLDGIVSIDLWHYPYVLFPFIYAVAVVLTNIRMRMYGSFRFKRPMEEMLRIFLINGVWMLAFLSFLYIIKEFHFTREGLFLRYLSSCILLIAKKWLARMIMRGFRKRGFNQKHVVVLGNGHLARQYIEDINSNPHLGITIDGYVSKVEKEGLGKNLGAYEDLEQILAGMDVDELVVALEPREIGFIKYAIDCADKEGTRLSLIPLFSDYMPSHVSMNVVNNTKIIDMRATPLDNIGFAALKRLIDIVGSALGLVLLSPLLLVVAVGVKLSSPGPILFRQERIGLNKKPFKMLKFRSMRVNDSQETGWSRTDDPRRTKFGSFIRKYSIDELPQLINVLKGEMSLVGPRPEVPYYVRQFKEDVPLYLVRQQVRPGMTGWAQIHGFRGDTSIEDRVAYDIWYIENWSLSLDINILFGTIFGGKFINNEDLGNGRN